MAKRSSPAPAKTTQANVIRNDGWINVLTGIGLAARDKRQGAVHAAQTLSPQDGLELYRGDDMAARIVEAIVDEMFRQGYEFQSDEGKDLGEEVMAWADEFGINEQVHEAECYARAGGGSALLLGANDGSTDLTRPLNMETIRTFDWMSVLTPVEAYAARYYEDPASPKFGDVEIYQVTQDSSAGSVPRNIHESRLVTFEGVRVTRKQRRLNKGWGDSVLMRPQEVLRDFQTSWASAAVLLQDFSQAIFKIKDLAMMIAANNDEHVLKRAQLTDLMRSVAKAIMIDSEEDFERKTTPIAGLPEMLDKFALRLAAAARTPVTILMGQSPAGLNATGDSDLRWYYDTVKSRQLTYIRPRLNKIFTCALRAKNGPTAGVEPKNWSIVFKPLWQMTDLEQANLRSSQAATDEKYINLGVVAPEEIRKSRFGGDQYSVDTQLDEAAFAELTEKLEEDRQFAMAPEEPADEAPAGEEKPEPKSEE